MTKTNTRIRIVSVLLVLVLLTSLMSGAAVPVHAFWDDYDDGFDCPNCNHSSRSAACYPDRLFSAL